MKRPLFAVLACCSFLGAAAQDTDSQSDAIVASGFHITRPLREIFAENPVPDDFSPVRGESKDRLHREPPKYEFTAEDGPQYGNDAGSLQSFTGEERGSSEMKASWNGGTASGFRPYDPSGAAGPSHYVQMINSTTFRIYNKTSGALLLTGTLGNLWNPVTGNSGDPIVLYDKPANRWMLAQFGTSSDRKIYIAVSTTADPTGSYYTYTYTSPQFPDYLKFSVWHDGYYMTSNQSTQKVFAFERTAMLAGTPGARAISVNYSPPKSGFFVPLAGCAADGTIPASGPCPIFSYSDNGWGASYFDRVNIYNMTVNWVPTTPTGSITLASNITAAAFDASYNASWNDCPQPGTTQKLDGIGGAMMYRAQWKSWSGYNSVVLNWAVRVSSTKRGIKWCELRQNQSTGTWSMYQEGIYTPGTDTRWMGSICMDNNGSIGLSYLRSNSTSMYASLYWTGRRSCDPLGTLPLTETLVVAGTGYQTGTNRVGDYAHQCLDPDGVTFWNTSEYMGGTSGASAARTRVFSYQISPCSNTAGVSIALTSGTNPTCTGASVTFTATPTNGGTSPSYQWKVNGANVGSNSTTYSTSSLATGSVVTCVMTSNLAGVTGNPATSNAITMTVSGTVAPSVAIAITAGSNPTNSGSSVTFTATPTNGGATPSYQWKVNGSNVGTNSATYTTTTLTNGAVVTCVMTSNSACASPTTATSNTITMTVNTVVTYCTAGTTNTTYERITNVTMGSINNTTGASSYSNYTSLSTNVSVGVAQSITVTIGNPYSSDRVLIWCDWNRNGTLTDAGEAVYASPQGVGPFTTNITPPAGTTAGGVRMRIRLTDAASGANLTPCGNSTYGEVEDYTLNVTGTLAPVVVNDTPPVEEPALRMETLEVFPNPSAGECTLKASSPGTYYVLNEMGVLVRSFAINSTNEIIQLKDLATGTYVISGQTRTGIVKQKLIVSH